MPRRVTRYAFCVVILTEYSHGWSRGGDGEKENRNTFWYTFFCFLCFRSSEELFLYRALLEEATVSRTGNPVNDVKTKFKIQTSKNTAGGKNVSRLLWQHTLSKTWITLHSFIRS